MKTIVITGTTSGLGKSLLSELIVKETKILAIDRSPNIYNKNSKIQAELDSLQLDLSEEVSDSLPLPDSIFREVNELIFVINAATIQPLRQGLEIPLDDLRSTFNVNFFSYVKLIQIFGKECERRAIPFRIFLVSTGSIFHPIYGWSAYSGSKGALFSFCKHVALENEGITFEAFDPGVFNSNMQRQISIFNEKDGLGNEPSVLAEPSEVSSKIVELLLG